MGWESNRYPNLPDIVYKHDYSMHLKDFHYDSSWNELMPVVEKIEKLYDEALIFYIKDCRAYIEIDTQLSMVFEIPEVPECYSGMCDTKIEAVYNTVIDFIKWYNTQPK